MTFGEKLVSRYVKHPTASDSELIDGRPIDAETAMLYHSNLSVLSERSCRPAGFSHPGFVPGYVWTAKAGSPYEGIVDLDIPADITPYNRVPWTLDNCSRFGPHPAVAVAFNTSPPGYLLRTIRVVVDYSWSAGVAGSKLYLAAALTLGKVPPRVEQNTLARDSTEITSTVSSTEDQWTIDLVPLQPVFPNAEWTCREATVRESVSRVVEAFAWVAFSSNENDRFSVNAISAFEVWQ